MIILLIIGWYVIGYNLTYDFVVPVSHGYGTKWKDWSALWLCATLWPLILVGMVIRLLRK